MKVKSGMRKMRVRRRAMMMMMRMIRYDRYATGLDIVQ